MTSVSLKITGLLLYKSQIAVAQQRILVDAVRDIVRAAPLFQPITPSGQQMKVLMTSAGTCGWYSDRAGYRYVAHHPNGTPWPPIPEQILKIWSDVGATSVLPDTCLINYYDGTARMGLHQDKDEQDFEHPVVSISLGDTARFRIGGTARTDPTQSFDLDSGDVLVMGGAARLKFHGVDYVRPGTSTLLPKGGRINLTLRVAH